VDKMLFTVILSSETSDNMGFQKYLIFSLTVDCFLLSYPHIHKKMLTTYINWSKSFRTSIWNFSDKRKLSKLCW